MNYKLYKIAANQVLRNGLPGNYNDEWLEANVHEKYQDLDAREIENKIEELYELLQVAFNMGRNFQIAEEERWFHYSNGVEYTNDEVQKLWLSKLNCKNYGYQDGVK